MHDDQVTSRQLQHVAAFIPTSAHVHDCLTAAIYTHTIITMSARPFDGLDWASCAPASRQVWAQVWPAGPTGTCERERCSFVTYFCEESVMKRAYICWHHLHVGYVTCALMP